MKWGERTQNLSMTEIWRKKKPNFNAAYILLQPCVTLVPSLHSKKISHPIGCPLFTDDRKSYKYKIHSVSSKIHQCQKLSATHQVQCSI